MNNGNDLGQLTFPRGSYPDGFTKSEFRGNFGDADTIVRELVQNGLDAALTEDYREVAEIDFTVASFPLDEIPGIEEYRRSFALALEFRQEFGFDPGGVEQDAVARIESALGSSEVLVLFCRDNGIGLNQKRMTNIVTESNDDKQTGLGTQGVGHLVSFAASNLRYVLYAGRTVQNGVTQDAASGQAYLAGHIDGQLTKDGRGVWQLPDASLYDRDHANFPSVVPNLMAGELNLLSDTGSIVALAGFDCFRSERNVEGAVELLQRSIVLNFLGAIESGRLVVRISAPGQGSITIDRKAVEQAIQSCKEEQRQPGRVSPDLAERALTTIRNGERIELSDMDGVEVYFRPLEDALGARPRVQVFRDGMWITDAAPKLTRFAATVNPFDAVVLLSSGSLYKDVRASEGPQHRGVLMENLGGAQRRRVDRAFSRIREQLMDRAGTASEEPFDLPPEWGISGVRVVAAQPAKPVTPRRRPRGKPKTPRPKPNPKPDNAPRDRPQFAVRSCLVPAEVTASGVKTLRGEIQLMGHLGNKKALGIRLYVDSGSDRSSEQTTPPTWIPLKQLDIEDESYEPLPNERYEIRVPPESTSFLLTLAAPVEAHQLGLLRIQSVQCPSLK